MRRTIAGLLVLAATTASPAQAEEGLVLYGAGSLREAVGEIARDFTAETGTPVRTEFGPSGLMRGRIEGSERVDVFTSADMGHPLKLRAEGRAVHVAMFTRNALCGMAKPELGLTSANFLDKLLDPAVKLGTSTPGADPSGDYTWAMFRLADKLRPGAFATLDGKAQQLVGGSMGGAGGPDPFVAAFAEGRVDLFIGYCSGGAARARDVPGLELAELPAEISVGPEYGLAILKDADPRAHDLAWRILSPEGQATLAKRGFKPIGLPAADAG